MSDRSVTILSTFGDWYSSPSNQNKAPENLKYIGIFNRKFMLPDSEIDVHLVSYTKSNGLYGRGFVNPINWSFFVDDDSSFNDEDLVTAYCGWAFLYEGVIKKVVKSDFQDKDSSTKGIWEKIKQELSTDFILEKKYIVGDLIYAEFEGTVNGVKAKQAVGNDNSSLFLDENDSRFNLPALWSLLGEIQQK